MNKELRAKYVKLHTPYFVIQKTQRHLQVSFGDAITVSDAENYQLAGYLWRKGHRWGVTCKRSSLGMLASTPALLSDDTRKVSRATIERNRLAQGGVTRNSVRKAVL